MPPCRWWQVRSAFGRLRGRPSTPPTARSSATSRPCADPPGGVGGGQVEGARGDVDVGDLHRHRLELRQRPAELGAALDVVGGQVAGARDQAGGGQRQAGDGVLGQGRARRPSPSSSAGAPSRTTVCWGPAARGRRRQQRDAGSVGSTSDHDRRVAVARRSPAAGPPGRRRSPRSCGRSPCRRRTSCPGRRDADAGLAQRRGQQRLAGGDAGQPGAAAARRCRWPRASARRSTASPRPAGRRRGRRSRGAAPPTSSRPSPSPPYSSGTASAEQPGGRPAPPSRPCAVTGRGPAPRSTTDSDRLDRLMNLDDTRTVTCSSAGSHVVASVI